VTRGQLDICLAQETGHSAPEWQLGLFVKIEGSVGRAALERAIRRVVHEAEPVRAAFVEVDGQVLQRAIDYPDVTLANPIPCGKRVSGVIYSTRANAFHRPTVQICVISDRDR